MIEKEKWEQMTDEQKLHLCESVDNGVNANAVTKIDWEIMFKFLLNKVKGSR